MVYIKDIVIPVSLKIICTFSIVDENSIQEDKYVKTKEYPIEDMPILEQFQKIG